MVVVVAVIVAVAVAAVVVVVVVVLVLVLVLVTATITATTTGTSTGSNRALEPRTIVAGLGFDMFDIRCTFSSTHCCRAGVTTRCFVNMPRLT